MHPDLLNNSTFLRYYSRWQADPRSAAFVAVADFFRQFQLYDDAIRVCEAGLVHNPDLISGRIVLAKVLIDKGLREEALVQLNTILSRSPEHREAQRFLELLGKGGVQQMAPQRASPETKPVWATITMARLFEQQGHTEQAAQVYRAILAHEPDHVEAREGLTSLGQQ